MSERVLVTGAAGFLGSHVTARLLERGATVLALDVAHDQGRLPDHPHLQRITGSVTDPATVDAATSSVDRIVHLAAIADVRAYSDRTLDVLETNLFGTRLVLRAAARARVPVLLASSSEAYGKHGDPLAEDGDTLLGPTTTARWSYAVSKIAGEHYAWALARAEGLEVAAVRYFNVYGPTLDAPGKGRVLSKFLGAIQAGEPLRLVDGGHAVRSFTWIDDAADATVALALALGTRPDLTGRVFNVARDEPVTIAQLAALVCRLAGHDAGVVEVDGAVEFGAGFEEIPHRRPDPHALQEAIGWRAATPLEVGIARVLEHWGLAATEPEAASPPPPIPVVRPVFDEDDALMGALRDVLASGQASNDGPHAHALETEAAAFLGVEPTEVVTVQSGAAGLLAGLLALGRTGTAILPSWTYVATLNAVELAGLTPVLCDIDPDTWTLSLDHLGELLAAHDDVGVVVPVSVYGVPPDLSAVRTLAAAHGAAVLHDAAHAFGTTVHGAAMAPGADVTVYSLHATKVLPATEGGLVVAAADVAARVRAVRTHGLDRTRPLTDARVGFNGKMDELSAAVARHGLARLDGILARRKVAAQRIEGALHDAGWTLQRVPAGVVRNHTNLVARVPDGTQAGTVADHLKARGIGSRRYFDPPLHRLVRLAPQPALPHTEALAHDHLCLPLHSRMADDVLDRIVEAIASMGAA